ncbi:MAG: hypothetical protein GY868_20195, partial [Deltaproteobacteria bacterium]|nr:hypothetical protein [Deltaproteobacteria bacterium]
KDEYYLIRRRKKRPGLFSDLKKRAKYHLTEFGSSALLQRISRVKLNREITKLGFSGSDLVFVDHHRCHAACAAFFSGFETALVITIDGIGDGLSGSINLLNDNELRTVATVSGKHSLGIFFEHVTNLMNMRELEDEGKVMALANYAFPIPDNENPLLNLITVEQGTVKTSCSSMALYAELKKILWQYPSEQFAYMAQRTLEKRLCELVEQSVDKNNIHDVCLAGGVFSNIKANMQIAELPAVDRCYVFPHMGDGGLALGAAAAVNQERSRVTRYEYDDICWGPGYTDDEIEAALSATDFTYEHCDEIEQRAAQLIADGHIVFWFQGRMEYGPRSLGSRSILARPNSQKIKDLLNLRLKMRVWYQPFCPSMLAEDAAVCLEAYDGLLNRYMTMGYSVQPGRHEDVVGVVNIDGSCRPQFVTDNEPRYRKLLQAIKTITGLGVVLNTSFNVHGEPLVCSPSDALATMRVTGNDYMVMNDFLVMKK